MFSRISTPFLLKSPLSLILISGLMLSGCNSFFGSKTTPTSSIPSPTLAPPTPTPPPLAALVNSEYLTLQEFESERERYLKSQQALGVTVNDEDAAQVVLEDLINLMLLSQGAREDGFEISESDLDARERKLAEDLGGSDQLIKWKSDHGYTDEAFYATLRRAIEATWMRDKIVADVPTTAEQAHIRQILAFSETDAAGIKARLDGGEVFDDLAKINDQVTGGELGWIPPGYLLNPQADAAVSATPVGMYSEVIETEAGFHIFYILERAERPLSPDALLTMQERSIETWLAEKRVKSDIVVYP